ncbi:MAG TPA: pyridoxamine 5'-phosphate oxidase family protein [Acidimicrobiales bacterium]|nr:pyridoxamine 5'-phosphate oxidase family protein [Acidimicrobiales bacterium]
MSVAVELEQLAERVAEYGSVAFLVTVGDDGSPHVTSAAVAVEDEVITAGAGRTTSGNVGRRPAVTVLWPAVGGDYCLIVDGAARIEGEGSSARAIVEPTRAVLHRIAGAPTDLPSCVTVLDRRADADPCTAD